jgi:hypothetical protein
VRKPFKPNRAFDIPVRISAIEKGLSQGAPSANPNTFLASTPPLWGDESILGRSGVSLRAMIFRALRDICRKIVCSLAESLALPAAAPSIALRIRVFGRELVAALAVGLRAAFCTGRAALEVFRASDRLKVVGIDAGAIAAQVVEVQCVGEVFAHCLIGPSVDVNQPSVNGYHTVAGVGQLPIPAPASVLVDVKFLGDARERVGVSHTYQYIKQALQREA